MPSSESSLRSPLSLNFIESCSGLLIGVIAWFWLRFNILYAKPWGWDENGGVYPDWFVDTRSRLLILIWPVAILVAISAVFLVRSYSENIRSFSQFGHFVLAWPLIDFLFLATVGSFGCLCLPIAFVLALIVTVRSDLVEDDYSNDALAIPYTIIWSLLGYWYAVEWWGLIGD